MFNWSCQGSNRSCVQDSTSARCCSPPARHSNHWLPHFLPHSLLCTLAYMKWLCHRACATKRKPYSSQNNFFFLISNFNVSPCILQFNNTGQQRFCPIRKNVCFWCIFGRWIRICFQNFPITLTFRSRLKGWNLLRQVTKVCFTVGAKKNWRISSPRKMV